ncbi:MAG TPA: LemA family protein [Fimbriimonas sp.]|nr:LemA family protein [Fimbriimonas sp.]
MTGASPLILVLIFAVLLMMVVAIGAVNKLARLKHLVRESWAQVDVALKRRYDLIPNLVEVCRAYAQHETETLERVIEARNRAMAVSGSASAHVPEEMALVASLNGLFARAEAYPQLKSSENFLLLQQELADTEDRIAAARRFYNANVRDYNTSQEQFPSSLFRGGHREADYFEIEQVEVRNAPPIVFGADAIDRARLSGLGEKSEPLMEQTIPQDPRS